MADDVFSAFPTELGERAPGSAELIYLRRALFVLAGKFFDPIAGKDAPLPPHRFAIAHDGTVFAEGTNADADGISTIFEPDLTGVAPDATWELFLIPIFDGLPDSDSYALRGEAWIDLETRAWVTTEAVEQDASLMLVTPRKLLRIPLWSSVRKAATGGFAQSPPAAADFASTGLLKTSELQPHGSRSSPWTVQIDHQWLRSYVQLHCYDPVAKADRCVPQGLLLTSHPRYGERCGGSSVTLAGGAIYVVNAGRKEDLPELTFAFASPETTLFAYADGKLRTETTLDTVLLASHYPLPSTWSSLGHEAWVGPGEASAKNRKPFADVRHEGGTADKPLCFHLDDLVVTGNGLHALGVGADGKWTLTSKRMCVLDSLLAVRSPATVGGATMPYSTIPFERQPLRAEEAFHVAGKGFEQLTRAIEYGGRIFSVDHQRMHGLQGLQPLVGARAARVQIGISKWRCEVHVLDTRWLTHAFGGVTARLAHVLCYVPTFVTAVDADDDKSGSNPAKTVGVPRTEGLMSAAAAVWSQGHPGNPAMPSPHKEYAIVPAAGLTADTTVLRVRAHFGTREQADRVEHGGGTDTKIGIHVHPQPGRATGGDPMELFMHSGHELHAKPVDPNPPAPAVMEFAPRGGATKDRYDNVEGQHFTLAHELGHSMDLPDEYIEHLTPPDGVFGQVGAFSGRERPFELDQTAMMNSNKVPRLRYLWPHVNDLVSLAATTAFKWVKAQLPLRAEAVVGGTRFEYTLPSGATGFGDHPTPWTSLGGSVGRVSTFLFLAGDDEDTRGMIVTPPGTAMRTAPFDGVLVVTSKYWFSFDDSIDDEKDRWELMFDEFAGPYVDRETCPHFMIESSGPWLQRVVIIVQPRCEIESRPTKLDNGKDEVIGNADIVVRVRKGDRVRDASKTPHALTIRKGDVGHFLTRYALSPTQAVFDARDNGKLKAGDFAPVNQWFANTFGRTSKVVPL